MSLWTNRSSAGPMGSNSSINGSQPGAAPLDLSRAVPVGMVLAFFIMFAIVGNILVILAVVCNRHLRIPTNYFIINLAIADLLLGTTVLPVSATLEVLDYWVFGRIFCDIWAAVDVLCCTASIMSLCAISIDRYIGVRYPLQYPMIVTEQRALLAMLGVWILSIVISIGPLLGWKQPPSQDDTVCVITQEPFYALFSSLGSFYIPLAVILAMYFRVYIVAKRTTKNLEAGVMKESQENSNELTLRIHCRNQQIQDLCPSSKGGSGGSSAGRSTLTVKLLKFSREKKAAKTLGVVVGMFILCWLPFFLALPIGSFNPSLRPPETFFKVIFWLGYFNSCLNPIIYPCYSREFKQVMCRLYQVCCFLGTPQQLSVVVFPSGLYSDPPMPVETEAPAMAGVPQLPPRCPPSAPAHSTLPPDPTLQHGPTPLVESFTQDPGEEVGPVRCPGLLRTRGRA
uniref:Adrenoceptor alpha 1B n=1 Tax=Takifugu rubripes TaxID=31033 RepID=H2T6N0_TAKRU